MTKLEKLIKELCPDGVVYEKLSQLAGTIATGKLNANAMVEDGEYPFFTCSIQNYRIDTYAFDCEALIVAGNGEVGETKYYKGKFNAYQRTYVLYNFPDKVNIQFLYHYLRTFLKPYVMRLSKKGSIPYITLGMLEEFKIPVPPIEVQREIVRILDNFTELTAELTEKLTAELTACKKQYEYYRDNVIISNQNVPMVKLGGFAEIIRGGNFQKKDFADEGRPCIHYGQMYTYFGVHTDKTIKYVSEETFNKSKQAVPNDIVMAVTSENVEDVCSCTAWVGEEAIAVSGHTAIIHHNQNAKYLSYYFHTSHFFSQKKKLAHGIKVIEVTPSKLADILVPLPSLEEQARIVSILDRFNVIFDDIFTGLLAEIEARQKQYEYYRENLLTFKELSV